MILHCKEQNGWDDEHRTSNVVANHMQCSELSRATALIELETQKMFQKIQSSYAISLYVTKMVHKRGIFDLFYTLERLSYVWNVDNFSM